MNGRYLIGRSLRVGWSDERMLLNAALSFVPVFVLVLFRVAGFMLFAPLYGSARIPKRARTLMAVILAMGMTTSVKSPPHLPLTSLGAAVAIGGEICFGLAIGMILSFVFIAAQWAGEMIGQQVGFNVAETFDPQYGQSSSMIGDMYYMLTLVIFLFIGGHRQIIRGLRDSFDTLPLMSASINKSVLDLVIQMFSTATMLAARLAAPILVTMLVVDMVLGFLGKTMPQMNVMTMGLSIKAMVGLVVLILGLMWYSIPNVLQNALEDSMTTARILLSHGIAT
jgi:flagellar biosynthetic protein FliR